MKVVGAACGHCHGGPVYMETCSTNGGVPDCIWVVASECQNCGHRFEHTEGCVEHGLPKKD